MLKYLECICRKEIFVYFLLLFPLLLLFYPTLFQGYILEGVIDRREITLPFHYLNFRAFQSGEYPQWNPYLFNGVPQSVIGMDYAWSPLNWPLYFWGSEAVIPFYFTWIQIIKHLLTGVFSFLFFKRVIPDIVGAGLAAFAYTWSAPTVWNMITSEFTVFLFFPLGMLILYEASKRLRPLHIALFGMIMAIDLGGGVLQWSFYLWLFWGSYAIYLSFAGVRIRFLCISVPTSLLLFFSGSTVAGFLSAPKMVPFVCDLLSGEAARGQGLSLSEGVQYSVTPLFAYIRLVSSNILGYVSYEYWDRYPLLGCSGEAQNYAETMLAHAGFIPLVLALVTLSFKSIRRQTKYPLIVLGVILLILPNTPLTYLFVAATSTGLKYSRLAVFLPFFLAWTAGIGLANVNRVRSSPFLKISMILFGVVVLGGIFNVFQEIATLSSNVKSYYLYCATGSVGILLIVVGVGFALWRLKRKRLISVVVFQTGLLFITMIELYVSAALFGVYTYHYFLRSKNEYYATNGNLSQVVEELVKSQNFRVSTFYSPLSFVDSPYPTANSNIIYGILQTSGFTNTIPKRVMSFAEAIAGTKTGGWTIYSSDTFNAASGVLWSQIRSRDEFQFRHISENPKPRAELVTNYHVVRSEEEVLTILRDGQHDFMKTILLTKNPSLVIEENAEQGAVEWLSSGPNTKRLQVEVAANSLLYIKDNYYPGWIAFIDEKPVEILSANYAFMAIPIPKGQHAIRLHYTNPHLRFAFILALLGGVLTITLCAFDWGVGKRKR